MKMTCRGCEREVEVRARCPRCGTPTKAQDVGMVWFVDVGGDAP